MADEDDVDAALALFEEEIKHVPAVLDEGPSLERTDSSKGPALSKTEVTVAGASPLTFAVPARISPVANRLPSPDAGSGYMHASHSHNVAPAPQPEWQRALQERDALSMRANLDVPQSTATKAPAGKSATEAVSAVPMQSMAAESLPVARPDATKSQLGAWVWDGWQWIWNPSAPSAPNGSQAGTQAESIVPASGNLSATQGTDEKNRTGKKKIVRAAAGNVWKDPSLEQWPEGDFRIFVGDLAPDATEGELKDAFAKYESYNMCRVVVDKRTGEGKGYGFVSFAKGEDMVAALREMNGKYVGTRPVKLKKSDWQKRSLTSDRRKDMKVFKSTGLVAKKRRHK